jgi:hypothetical protein
VGGKDRHGREIDLNKFSKQAINRLQREFTASMKKMAARLDEFYSELAPDFEARFSPKFRAAGSWGEKSRKS